MNETAPPPIVETFAALPDAVSMVGLGFQEPSDAADARQISFRLGGADIALYLRVLHATAPPDAAEDAQENDALLEVIAVADLGAGLGLDTILGAFAELFGGTPPELPDWLVAQALPRLKTFALRFDGDLNLAHVSASIGIGSAAHFEILPDLIGVDDLALALSLDYPFDDERAEIGLTVTGGIELGAARIETRVTARDTMLLRKEITPPPEASSEALAEKLSATLLDTENASLGEEIGQPADAGSISAGFKQALQPPDTQNSAFSHLTVSGWLEKEVPLTGFASCFGLEAPSVGTGAVLSDGKFQYISETGAYAFAISLIGARRVEDDETYAQQMSDPYESDPLSPRPTRAPLLDLPGGLVLNEAVLHIGGSIGSGDFYAQIMAQMQLSNARMEVTASYTSATEGLFFEGRWSQADLPPLPIDDIVEARTDNALEKDPAGFTKFLTQTLNLTLPEPLQDLEVHAIDLQIDTGLQSLAFDLDIGLSFQPFDDKTPTLIDARLNVDVHREGDAFAGKFHGVLAVGDPEAPWELDMLIARSEGQTALVAGYRADPGGGDDESTHSVGALAGALQLGTEIGSLDVAVREAVLVVSKGGSATDFLFSADVEAGLDLTRIEIPGLPILGDLGLGGPDTLRLRVKIAFARDGSDGALSALAAGAGFHPPETLTNGFQILPILQIGDRVLAIDTTGADGATAPVQREELDTSVKSPPAGDTSAALGDEAHWIDVQRAVGPVRVKRVGVALHRPDDGGPSEVRALIDASMEMAGLTIAFEGLSVSAALGDMVPHFSIDGLGIDYHGGIEIGGALFKRGNTFAGELIASSGPFSLSAIGLYEAHEEVSSFMAHAVVDYPIGGPAFFFITGFAAGFGVNRGVVMPEPAAIGTFPLIAQARSPAPRGQSRDSRLASLGTIRDALPFHAGEYFISAGVQFNSFKTIDSVALLIVLFGEQLAFKLLGESILSSPPKEAGAPPLAYARLMWDVEFTPDEGTLKLDATLAPESFVLDRNCRLHGGMAFHAWFKTPPHAGPHGPQEGEFVLTIGGYHPSFDAPAHFPKVDDVGFDWTVNENLTIKGSAYFALTGGAIMAGGTLDATWVSGDVKVSFNAEADFMIAWRPHHYDIHMRVQIDGEVTVHFLGAHTLELHAAADLHLWGPDFAGRGTVHVSILGYDVDFSIAFNDSPRLSQAIEWERFAAELLPEKVLSLAPAGGQLAEIEGKPLRFDRRDMKLRVETAIPFTRTLGAPEPDTPPALGIYPCGERNWSSTFTVAITDENGASKTEAFDIQLITGTLPAALWGRPEVKDFYGTKTIAPPAVNAQRMIANALTGVEIAVKQVASAHDPDQSRAEPAADATEVINRTIRCDPVTGSRSQSDNFPMSFDQRARMLRAFGFSTHRLAQSQAARTSAPQEKSR